MHNKIITPKVLDELGLKRVCRTCRPKELLGKGVVKNLMCPTCGNHYDEYGNHNKHKALKWMYATFKQAGFELTDMHLESLYNLARIKVAQNESAYIEVMDQAIEALASGNRPT